ncbi:DUF1800 domain-containing protein [Sulfitobacter mediterraneus]|uniref:Uncharacterized protein (DUF1800 family) n=1 Tax=Sulfitobacter mediterraneus TaxID=83219 RepID=A0A2T6BYR1_9RHOB|nr:DUF1800 domain-containing protein [Sulfitobacter mediterraneus]KIN75603.1 DUF1800 domain containing protein [Sulfitobacter mediterraneus KCTC 32188]PTX61202.1 uncharacterized protein (DUF1800 family) [Sulfitobacter mediterraneus]
MPFTPEMAERRFGYGLSPQIVPPFSVAQMLSGLQGADVMAQAYPIPGFRHIQDQIVYVRRFSRYSRKNPETEAGQAAEQKAKLARRALFHDRQRWTVAALQRRIGTPHAFRERLIAFWADHFTARGKSGLLRAAAPAYLEEALRPHVSGKFADLLRACVTHPLMLHYLDQNTSAGPNSRAAQRPDRQRGLNENLAREVLELHTLGVGGPYTQNDVHELAKLLTGLAGTRDYSFKFRRNMAEPGAETVLGRSYGGPPGLAPIHAVLTDLALHPATAAHIARKLAVHFVSDTPPPDLIEDLQETYLGSGGDLMTCYAALLHHPASWTMNAPNIRPPDEFVGAALRAMAVKPEMMEALRPAQIRRLLLTPMRLMGQAWQQPAGPDGWPEDDGAWITPQGIAARLDWAVNAPAQLRPDLPDPRNFVHDALGPNPPADVVFAASAAETRADAIGLVLCAPAFQRR